MDPSPRTLSERYRLTGHLARGGMADVFSAQDELLGRRVAVKILHPHFAADPPFVSRFQREAMNAANLSHPNIVSIFDWGREDDTYFMVMELIEGRTLRDIVRSEGALLPRRAAEIAAEAAAALTVAHHAGVIHRDFKPGNIMIATDGSVKVTDFGIARALDDSEELTKTGAVIGTATYFSPEQAQGLPADERSDVYSLGVVLYELLAGRAPFAGESPVAVAYQHVSSFPTPPSSVNPDVPETLDAIVMRAMEKRPDDRYQSAEELRNDLLRFLRGDTPVAAVPVSPDAATMVMSAPPPPTVPPDETARHVAYPPADEPSQTVYVLGIVGLVLALGIGIFVLTRLLSSPAETTATVTVPPLENLAAQEAFDRLQELDLKITQRPEASSTVTEGLVIATIPSSGAEVETGTFVTVIFSTGPERFPVPNLIGETEQAARDRIAQQQLELGSIEYRFTENTEEGIVLDQSPDPGMEVPPGSAVSLEISSGPFLVQVPPVAGLTEANARRELEDAGFEEVVFETDVSEDVLAGFVIGTQPEAGQLAPRGAMITVVVSEGPPPAEVPDLIGLEEIEATQLLETFGLELSVTGDPVPVSLDSGLAGFIAQQSPGAGAELEVGGIVTVQIGELRTVSVPDLSGLLEDQARRQLSNFGLVLEVAGTVEDADNVGRVVSQTEAPGTEIVEGSTVAVTLGVAPATTTTTTTTSTTTTSTTTTSTTTTTTTVP